ncbi:hypothetical protein Q5M87_11270, partial [Brachyspira innocens]|uniref:hypothetical protein n=1 Tax=Brachyspira innocens TaxID=13264 RepID=UPI0026F1066F
CKDLTYLFFKTYKKLQYDINKVSNSFNLENKIFFSENIENSEHYNIKFNNELCSNLNKRDYILKIGEVNGDTAA